MSQLVRAKITALGTYVPPRLLTNDDLEKLVETSNDWIVERTGIRERHIVDKGVATSDLATEAATPALAAARPGALRSGRDHRRHGHSRHVFPLHRLPGAAQAGRKRSLGIRSFRCLLRLCLRTANRSAIYRHRRAQESHGDRSRRDVFDHRLHRSRHLRDLRRRRRRCHPGAGGERLRRLDRFHSRSGWLRRMLALHARRRQSSIPPPRKRSRSACTTFIRTDRRCSNSPSASRRICAKKFSPAMT